MPVPDRQVSRSTYCKRTFKLYALVLGDDNASDMTVIIPPGSNPYGAPRSMVLGWGALLAGLGTLWYVGFNAGEFLPVTFAVLIIITGIAAVGYSLMRAQPKKPSVAVA